MATWGSRRVRRIARWPFGDAPSCSCGQPWLLAQVCAARHIARDSHEVYAAVRSDGQRCCARLRSALLIRRDVHRQSQPVVLPRRSALSDAKTCWAQATLDFSPMTFERTQGYCRSGDSWSHTPALRTTMGSVTGGSNNAHLGVDLGLCFCKRPRFGDNLWFCFAQPRTMLGCLGECEARADCLAVDRPAMDQREECCLFSGGGGRAADHGQI